LAKNFKKDRKGIWVMKKLKVIQTPVRFYPSMGGVENHVYYLSKELVKRGIDIKVICAKENGQNASEIIDDISIKRISSPFKFTNTDITPVLPIVLLREDFDVIHTHMPTPWTSDISIFIARIKNKKSIITIHNDMDKPGFINKLITKIYLYTFFRLSLYLVSTIIIVNPNWENSFMSTGHLLKKYKNKIKVIPNGIDIDLFKYKKNIKRSKNEVLFVSILDKYHTFKGLKFLLTAFSITKQNISDIKLTVIGDGELKKDYVRLATDLGIRKDVNFIGVVSQKKLSSYYSKASVFVLPSYEIEGFGIVLLEAMACGLPVIATDITGLSKDIKKYDAGIVIPPKDPQILSESIIEMLINKKKAKEYASNAKKLITKKYRWEMIANKILSTYFNIL